MAVSLYEFKFKGSCVLYGAGGGSRRSVRGPCLV